MLSSTDRFVNELKKELSSENVLSEIEERYAYAQDASNSLNIYNIPDAVVFVRNTKDVVNVIKKAARLCLHAAFLSFTHPFTGEVMTFTVCPDFLYINSQDLKKIFI